MTPEEWLNINCRNKNERDADLLKRSVETLYANVIPGEKSSDLPWGKLRGIAPSLRRYRGVWNWDSAFHALAICRWDPELAREQAEINFMNQREDGCFIDVCYANGEKVTDFSKPPVWFWIYELIDRADPNVGKLKEAYAHLVKCEQFWSSKRFKNGLFHYGCDYHWMPEKVKYESGWDNSPRWDGNDTDQLWAIDLNCYMVLAYRALGYMAERLDHPDEQEAWRQKEICLSALINEKLWCRKLNGYSDMNFVTESHVGVISPASFMPLFIKIASQDQADKMAGCANSTGAFFPLMPSCSYCHPEYVSSEYWRGPTWINIAYMAVKGLKNYGYDELAKGYCNRILDICDAEKRGIFEYYDSKCGTGLGAVNYGWSASFILEFILNL